MKVFPEKLMVGQVWHVLQRGPANFPKTGTAPAKMVSFLFLLSALVSYFSNHTVQ